MRSVLLPLVCLLMLSAPAGADDRGGQERARQALQAGQVLPLRTVLERIERDYPGQVIEVELESKDERWVYELKILQPGGLLTRLHVDARDATVLRQRSRGAESGARGGVRSDR